MIAAMKHFPTELMNGYLSFKGGKFETERNRYALVSLDAPLAWLPSWDVEQVWQPVFSWAFVPDGQPVSVVSSQAVSLVFAAFDQVWR